MAMKESLQSLRLAIIGGGRMGEAIVGGLVRSGAVSATAITVAETDANRRDALQSTFGVECTGDGAQAVHGADIVLLAVKPQVIESVTSQLGPELSNALVISIAAGISCARLESVLPSGTAVVRVMPNTPALVGEGMALVSGGSETAPEQVELVAFMFGSLGKAVIVDEKYQDAGTAISGSGPAYFALVVDALARAGVAHGLTRELAQTLATQTMLGTARMLAETGIHPGELIDAVSSPGGTTVAAIERLEAGGVRSAFAEGVTAAVKRSKELGS